MRKSIFFRLALLIVAIIIVLDCGILFVSYRITYNNQLLHSTETIKRNAEIAELFMEQNYPDSDEDARNVSEYFRELCSISEITYLYAVSPYIETNRLTYIAIGFGEDADDNAVKERYHGVTVQEPISKEMAAAYNGDNSGVVEHYENQYGETIACYLPMTRYYDSHKREYVDLDRTIVIAAEENITSVISSIRSRFNTIAIFTVILTIVIVLLIFLILYFKISKPIKLIGERMKSFVSDRDKGFEKLPVKGEDELSEMSRSLNSMADEIDTYIINIDRLNKEKHKQQAELDIAHRIQNGMLKPPSFSGGGVSINAYMLAAKNVGGDLYDYTVLNDGRIYMMIADVSGKGISASLFMSRGLTLLQQYVAHGYSPAQMLGEYNNTLAEHNPGKLFITTFAAVYDPVTHELIYSNGGHNHPYIVSDELIVLDDADGVAAGIFSGAKYKEASITLKEGDVLFMYTDGVNEAENKDGGFFGTEALEGELRRHIGSDTDRIIDDVLKKLREFSACAEQNDDITMLTMRVTEAAPKSEFTKD